jgi:hypothetical protein
MDNRPSAVPSVNTHPAVCCTRVLQGTAACAKQAVRHWLIAQHHARRVAARLHTAAGAKCDRATPEQTACGCNRIACAQRRLHCMPAYSQSPLQTSQEPKDALLLCPWHMTTCITGCCKKWGPPAHPLAPSCGPPTDKEPCCCLFNTHSSCMIPAYALHGGCPAVVLPHS